MGIKRVIAESLDRPGCRWLLCAATNRLARRQGYTDLAVHYRDGRWFHRTGRTVFPGGQAFRYFPHAYRGLAALESLYLSEAADYWLHFYKPKPGDVIVDVGAGQGEDVLSFSRAVGTTGKVLAIEAFPSTYRTLEEFCARNHLANTIPLQLAIMDEPGWVSFQAGDDWSATEAVKSVGDGPKVRGVTLADVCAEHQVDQIDYLKMNIEGAEVMALKGMKGMLHRIKSICVSCHDFRADRGEGEYFRTRDFVIDFLGTNGFKLKFRDDPRPHVRDQVFGVLA